MVTFFTFVVLLITIFIFVFFKGNKNYFLYFSILFSGFTGTTVLEIFGIAIQPGICFFIIYVFWGLLKNDTYKIRLNPILIVFFIYSSITVLFPLLLQSQNITTDFFMNKKLETLRFTSSNIVHIIYLLMVLYFLNCLLKYKKNFKEINKMCMFYRIGFYLVVLICIYQIIAFKFDLPFDVLFRQNTSGNIQGNRIYGPCIEASMLCHYLIPSIIITLFTSRRIISIIFSILAIFLGIYSNSSTFLIGLAMLVILGLALLIKYSLNKKTIRTILLSCFVLIVVVLVMHQQLFAMVNSLIDKLKLVSFSGQDRFNSFKQLVNIAIDYPFGIGFGSTRSADLFSTWLCNVGFIGVGVLLVWIITYIYSGIVNKNIIFMTTFLMVLLLCFISVPEPYNLYVWFSCFLGCLEINNTKIQ